METRIRVIVCGIKFGRQYLAALTDLNNKFDVVGILSTGSAESFKVSEQYDIPLYQSMNEIPQDIEAACVVVRTGVMGGKGTELSLALLERGIHVITEQPMHHQDIAKCYQTASRNHVIFYLGDLYPHLRSVRCFINSVKEAGSHQAPLYLNLDASMQVLYPLVQILQNCLGSIRLMTVTNMMKEEDCPFQILTGKISEIPYILRLHNEVFGSDSDNFFHLLHSITVGFGGGHITMEDTHGPVVWNPRFHISENADAAILTEAGAEILGETVFPSLQAIAGEEWPQAIGKELLNFSDFITGNRSKGDYIVVMQNILLSAQQWQILTKAAGYPVLREAGNFKFLSSDIFSAKKKDKIEKTAALPQSPFSGLRFEVLCGQLADQADEYDEQKIRYGKELVDQVVAWVILHNLNKQGVFTEKNKKYSAAEVLAKVEVKKEFSHIIRRWLRYLSDNGSLENADDTYWLNEAVPGYAAAEFPWNQKLAELWNEAKSVWMKDLTNQTIAEYLEVNIAQLPGLMDGTVQAATLLFPEGRMDIANSLYRETISAKYLNRKVAECVRILNSKAVRPLSVLEVGAGTGATTDQIIAGITSEKEVRISSYCYTDISSYFFAEAKKRYRDILWLEYQRLNVDQDFEEQGIAKESKDIVIAVGILNNSRNIDEAIGRLYDTLVSGGYLLVVEPTNEPPEMLVSQVFMMEQPSDVRKETETTFVPTEEWRKSFLRSGGKHVSIFPDEEHPLRQLGQNLFITEKR